MDESIRKVPDRAATIPRGKCPYTRLSFTCPSVGARDFYKCIKFSYKRLQQRIIMRKSTGAPNTFRETLTAGYMRSICRGQSCDTIG